MDFKPDRPRGRGRRRAPWRVVLLAAVAALSGVSALAALNLRHVGSDPGAPTGRARIVTAPLLPAESADTSTASAPEDGAVTSAESDGTTANAPRASDAPPPGGSGERRVRRTLTLPAPTGPGGIDSPPAGLSPSPGLTAPDGLSPSDGSPHAGAGADSARLETSTSPTLAAADDGLSTEAGEAGPAAPQTGAASSDANDTLAASATHTVAAAPRAPRTEADAAASMVSVRTADRVRLQVRSGDSLDRLFRRNQLSVADLHAMLSLPEAKQGLRVVRPGDTIDILHTDARVLQLSRRLDDFHLLRIARQAGDDAFVAEVIEELPERRVVHASGRITSSLFNAGRDAGISDALVMKLAGIFAWDIDFVLDIRVGDQFTVLYEELWRDGRKLRDGAILAAEFVNAGEAFRAIRYVDPEGRADYFTPDGLSVRKAFLRAPVDFTRISSNFNPRRRHPVLNTIRAHRGVDYAAPVGTPIKAAGDGKVSFRGVKGGYGNVVILQHGDNISTLYAHMSRFGRYGSGARVRQGDVIGYVGATGRVTGPHLHYEYRIAGVHRNPRTVELPEATPVASRYRADFRAHTEYVLAQLELVKSVRLAGAL